MGISAAFQAEDDDVVVLTTATNVSGNLVLDPGSYALSAKLYIMNDQNGDAVVTCGLVSAAPVPLDTTVVSVMKNRSVALALATTLDVGASGNTVRVRCIQNNAEAVPKAMSVKLIAIQVGG